MFGLFGKKGESPEERLAECQQKRDWAGLARAYYQMGVAAMEQQEYNRAQLWLSRADTIYSADDKVYKKLGEKLMDDCSERIGKLEEASLLYNNIPAQVEEMTADLGDSKVRVWGLLSLARLVKLGERLGSLPGCEALGKLGWAVDLVLKSFQEAPTEEEFYGLRDLCGALYELGDSPAFWGAGSQIEVPGGAPFQIFDLNGMMGVHLEIDAYLDGHLRMICALGQGEESPVPETGIIAGALLPDYHVRSGAGKPEEVPGIKAELDRMWSDYHFVCSDFTWEQVGQKVREYKELDILGN
ncbi:hypothetical protein IMSAGC003_04111 [Lachnospiraceae bacterium]|nr:hypothetical protein [Acetatifactor sp.]GFH97539.1 hypothetical protein IMSAGC003_04111 [Lachnospiraceae bacterium]